MTKRTIEIDDTLDVTIQQCKHELLNVTIDWLEEHAQGKRDWYEFCRDTTYDWIPEIVDSNMPIYYTKIDGLYYLYGDEFEEAYRNVGAGDGGESNHRQVTIYYYLEQQLYDYLDEMQEVFNLAEGETIADIIARIVEMDKNLTEEKGVI